MAWAEVYFGTKCGIHPSTRLATTDRRRKLGGGCAPLREGELGPHLDNVAWIDAHHHAMEFIVSDIAIFVLKRDVKLQLTN